MSESFNGGEGGMMVAVVSIKVAFSNNYTHDGNGKYTHDGRGHLRAERRVVPEPTQHAVVQVQPGAAPGGEVL